MPRLAQVSKDDAHPFAQSMYTALFGDRDPVAEPGTATGTPGDWWTVFALVPDAFDHTTAGFQFYRSDKRELSDFHPFAKIVYAGDCDAIAELDAAENLDFAAGELTQCHSGATGLHARGIDLPDRCATGIATEHGACRYPDRSRTVLVILWQCYPDVRTHARKYRHIVGRCETQACLERPSDRISRGGKLGDDARELAAL